MKHRNSIDGKKTPPKLSPVVPYSFPVSPFHRKTNCSHLINLLQSKTLEAAGDKLTRRGTVNNNKYPPASQPRRNGRLITVSQQNMTLYQVHPINIYRNKHVTMYQTREIDTKRNKRIIVLIVGPNGILLDTGKAACKITTIAALHWKHSHNLHKHDKQLVILKHEYYH
jgi:hypothetical protein